MKRRALLQLEQVRTGADLTAKIEGLESELSKMQPPLSLSFEADMDKSYSKLKAACRKAGYLQGDAFTVLDFYTAVELIEAEHDNMKKQQKRKWSK